MYNLSIIVPVYQVKQYLKECLDSIINQTYKDWELIIIDDGSTDGSSEICDLYASDRVKVIHQSNSGLSCARNAGLSIATGKYIGFIDSDDYILPNYFYELISIAERYDADIVCSKIGKIDRENKITNFEIVLDNSQGMKELIIQNLYNHGVCTKLFRATIAKQVFFPIGLTSEDVLYSYEAFKLAKTIISVDFRGYIYRIRPNSITTRNFSLSNFDLFNILKIIKEKIKFDYPKFYSIFCDKYFYAQIYYLEQSIKYKNYLQYKQTYNKIFYSLKMHGLKFCFQKRLKIKTLISFFNLFLLPKSKLPKLSLEKVAKLRNDIRLIIHNPTTYRKIICSYPFLISNLIITNVEEFCNIFNKNVLYIIRQHLTNNV